MGIHYPDFACSPERSRKTRSPEFVHVGPDVALREVVQGAVPQFGDEELVCPFRFVRPSVRPSVCLEAKQSETKRSEFQ